MSDLSEDQWDRLRAAWQTLHPASYPDRSMMIDDAISAMEFDAASLLSSEANEG